MNQKNRGKSVAGAGSFEGVKRGESRNVARGRVKEDRMFKSAYGKREGNRDARMCGQPPRRLKKAMLTRLSLGRTSDAQPAKRLRETKTGNRDETEQRRKFNLKVYSNEKALGGREG